MNEELPPGWERVALEDLVSEAGVFSDGDWVESKDQDPDGEVRLIQLADVGLGEFRDRSSRFLTRTKTAELNCTYLKPKDVLVARMPDPLGRACKFPDGFGACVTVVDVAIVRPGPQSVNPTWLMWSINSPQCHSQIEQLQSGTTRKRISRKNLATIHLAVPPLAEQSRIVAAIEEHFSRLDAAEAATGSSVNRIPSLLEAAVQAHLHKYSTSSAPLHRFLTQRLSNGRSVPTATTDGFPVLRLTCLRDGTVATSETKQGDFGDVDPTRYVIEPDDFLISRGNGSLHLVGLGGLVPAGASSVAYPDTLIRARVDQSRLRPNFLSHVWNSRLVREQVEAQARTTAGIYKINQTMIEQVSLPIPSPDDQDRIARQLDELRSSVRMTEREVERARQRIAELRRSVLADAFSGRLVPQDPDDEPALVLLERIATSRPTKLARRRART